MEKVEKCEIEQLVLCSSHELCGVLPAGLGSKSEKESQNSATRDS